MINWKRKLSRRSEPKYALNWSYNRLVQARLLLEVLTQDAAQNGARIRLAPQKHVGRWIQPEQLARVLAVYGKYSSTLIQLHKEKHIGILIADLIVLGGSVGIEKAGKAAGFSM